MISWVCPNCGLEEHFPAALADTPIKCPKCKCESTVTSSAAERRETLPTAGGGRQGTVGSGTQSTSLFHGFLGNASAIDPTSATRAIGPILLDGERVELAFILIRDLIVFTSRRLVFVDKQGITGKKVEYHSIPYKNITHFSVETAGHLDLDSELKVYVSGKHEPIAKQFNKKKTDIFAVQRALATAILR